MVVHLTFKFKVVALVPAHFLGLIFQHTGKYKCGAGFHQLHKLGSQQYEGLRQNIGYDYIGLGLMTAAIYFALSYPASLLANRLERKLRYDHR